MSNLVVLSFLGQLTSNHARVAYSPTMASNHSQCEGQGDSDKCQAEAGESEFHATFVIS